MLFVLFVATIAPNLKTLDLKPFIVIPSERHRGALKLIIRPQESSATSTSAQNGRGPEMLLTLLISLLLLPLSRKTLDMCYLILIG
jgi:hypothetical protein